MSGAVEVLEEPDGVFVVACFNTDCPEHGWTGAREPWAGEFPTRTEANQAARSHRAEIRSQFTPICPTCGREAAE